MDKYSCLKNDITPGYIHLSVSVSEVRLTTHKGIDQSHTRQQQIVSEIRNNLKNLNSQITPGIEG